jgi:hypothetical protein
MKNKYQCPYCGVKRVQEFPTGDEKDDSGEYPVYCPDCNWNLQEEETIILNKSDFRSF